MPAFRDSPLLRAIWRYTVTTGDNIRYVVQLPALAELCRGRYERGLDAGGGSGMYTQRILLPNCERVAAVDVGIAGLQRMARRLQPSDRARLQIAEASLNKLPFADGSFDLILCSEVLEHIADDLGALQELARVARDGATVVLAVPHPPAPFPDGAHVREGYTLAALTAQCAQAGLEVEEHRYCFFGLSRAAMRLSRAVRRAVHVPPPLQVLPVLERMLWREAGVERRPYDLMVRARKM